MIIFLLSAVSAGGESSFPGPDPERKADDAMLEILNQIAGEVDTTSDQDQYIRVSYYYGSGREAEREYNVREETYQALQHELYSIKDYKEAIGVK